MSNRAWGLIYASFISFWVYLIFWAPEWMLYSYMAAFGLVSLCGIWFAIQYFRAEALKKRAEAERSWYIQPDERGNFGQDIRPGGRNLNLPPKGASVEELQAWFMYLITNNTGGGLPRELVGMFTPSLPQGNDEFPLIEGGKLIEAVAENYK